MLDIVPSMLGIVPFLLPRGSSLLPRGVSRFLQAFGKPDRGAGQADRRPLPLIHGVFLPDRPFPRLPRCAGKLPRQSSPLRRAPAPADRKNQPPGCDDSGRLPGAIGPDLTGHRSGRRPVRPAGQPPDQRQEQTHQGNSQGHRQLIKRSADPDEIDFLAQRREIEHRQEQNQDGHRPG